METNIKDKIEYKLVNASFDDIDMLINYKLSTIYEYAGELDKEEKKRIDKYVNEEVKKCIDKYKVIMVDSEKIGAYLVDDYDNGKILDEIYIIENYRCKGIGRKIIEDILKQHIVVYLWVYKMNEKALRLYKRLGFNIEEETESRYFMKYVRKEDINDNNI